MSIALHAGSRQSASARPLAKLVRTARAVAMFGLVIALVAFARTFVFEYFHGDSAAIHGLVQALLRNLQ